MDDLVQFTSAPNPPLFHLAKRGQFKRNSSKRAISAEIEVAGVRKLPAYATSAVQKWRGGIVHDGSLPSSGFEINTAPASGDLFVQQIEEICDALKKQQGFVNRQCGLHVHIDCRDLTWYDIRKVAFLYAKIEDAMFAIISPSRKGSTYCHPCGKSLITNLEANKIPKDNEKTLLKNVYGRDVDVNSVRRNKYDSSRYAALNVHSWLFRGTIENRMHHGTISAEKIINWALLNTSMIDYALEHTEQEIKEMKGDSMQILTEVASTPVLKEWVVARRNHFSTGDVRKKEEEEQ